MKHPRISEHPCCLIRSLRIVFKGKEGELLPWYTPWPPIPCKQLTVHLVASNYSIDDIYIYIYPPVIKGGWKNPKLNGGFKFSEHHRTKWWMFKPRLEDPVVPDRCPVAKWILHPFQRIHELLEGNVRKTLSQLMMFNQDWQQIHLATPRNYTNGHRKMWFHPPPHQTERFLGVKLSAQGDQPTIMSHGKNTSIPLHYTGWLIGIPMIDFRNPWQTRCYDLWFNHHLSLGYDLWSPIWQKKQHG